MKNQNITPKAPQTPQQIEESLATKQSERILIVQTKMNGFKVNIYQNPDTTLDVEYIEDLQEIKTFNLLTPKGKAKIELQYKENAPEPFKAFYISKLWIFSYIQGGAKSKKLFAKVRNAIEEQNPFALIESALTNKEKPSDSLLLSLLGQAWLSYKENVIEFASFFSEHLQEGQTLTALTSAFKRRYIQDKEFVWVEKYYSLLEQFGGVEECPSEEEE